MFTPLQFEEAKEELRIPILMESTRLWKLMPGVHGLVCLYPWHAMEPNLNETFQARVRHIRVGTLQYCDGICLFNEKNKQTKFEFVDGHFAGEFEAWIFAEPPVAWLSRLPSLPVLASHLNSEWGVTEEDIGFTSLYTYKFDGYINALLRGELLDEVKFLRRDLPFFTKAAESRDFVHGERGGELREITCPGFADIYCGRLYQHALRALGQWSDMSFDNFSQVVIPSLVNRLMLIADAHPLRMPCTGYRALVIEDSFVTPTRNDDFVSTSVDPMIALADFGIIKLGDYEKGAAKIVFMQVTVQPGTSVLAPLLGGFHAATEKELTIAPGATWQLEAVDTFPDVACFYIHTQLAMNRELGEEERVYFAAAAKALAGTPLLFLRFNVSSF